MIGLLLNALTFLIPAILYFTNCSKNGVIVLSVLAIAYLICNVISFCCSYNNQVYDIEGITESVNKREIFKRQKVELITEAKFYLGENFMKHEKELFKLISESGKDSKAVVNFLSKFPEIRSVETLKQLVTNIQGLHRNVYNKELEIEELKKQIRVRSRNPYMIRCILPTYKE